MRTFVSNPKPWQRLIRVITRPLSTVVGKITWRMGRPYSLYDHEIEDIKSIIRPGMTILTYTNYQASNLFIKGKYKHTATYVGDGYIVQATSKGVTKDYLEDLLRYVDGVAILKPRFADSNQMLSVAKKCEELVGYKYDYNFDFNPGRNRHFYCAEIQWQAWYDELKEVPFEPEIILGEWTLLPNSFYTSGNWEIILEVE